MENLAPTAYRLFAEKKYKDAITAFKKEINQYSENPEMSDKVNILRSDLAVALTMDKQTSEAILILQELLDHYTQTNDLYHSGIVCGNLAVAHEKSGDKKTAVAFYEKASEHFTQTKNLEENYHCKYSAALLYLQLGEKFKAIAALNAALSLKPNASIKDRALKRLMRIANL